MDLDYMILANYAEAPGGGLISMIGGGWDTINVAGPVEIPPDAPPQARNAVAVIQGSLVVRLLIHSTETNREHKIEIVVVDEDGGELGKIEGELRAEKAVGLPPSWDQGLNMVFPLSGMFLNKFGLHRISLLIDGRHLGDREFRVLKHY